MAHKYAFQLTAAGGSDRYAIRLTDKQQIIKLAVSEGFAKPIPFEPIIVVYDEGSGELVPEAGFDDRTARGRMINKILADVYADAVDAIMAGEGGLSRAAG